MTKPREIIVGVLDLETDPFAYGRHVRPFAFQYVDSRGARIVAWGRDCVAEGIAQLESLPYSALVYAHNGGRFDFIFLLPYLDAIDVVVDGRIVKCRMGKHELRDSFAILPTALGKTEGGKIAIDYRKFTSSRRELHKAEILRYLDRDCWSLLLLVEKFRARFGDKLTIGAAALAEMKKHHAIERMRPQDDQFFRPLFYGGRVQAFKGRGIYPGPWRVYDVRSMYPWAMARCWHPVGGRGWSFLDALPRARHGAWFFQGLVELLGSCLPVRDKRGLAYYPKRGVHTVRCTGHEIRMAMTLGLCALIHVESVWMPQELQEFSGFVEHWYAEKARASGDDKLFAKLILNSAYGKLAIDPTKFQEYQLTDGIDLAEVGWELVAHHGAKCLWSRPDRKVSAWRWNDVAAAASITGAARARLMEAIALADEPAYCDTDSVICRNLPIPDDGALGGWELRGEYGRLALAGKKLYALGSKEGRKWLVAHAKGGQLTGEQIARIARGGRVRWKKPSPAGGIRGFRFIEREFKATI